MPAINVTEIYKIAIACDHAGFDLKSQVINHLSSIGHSVLDLGTNSSTLPVDYPDYAKLVCEQLVDEDIDFGILICGSGIGMSIAANRFSQIRAALCTNSKLAFFARAHTDANLLILAARFNTFEEVKLIVDAFFTTGFEGARHANRIAKLG